MTVLQLILFLLLLIHGHPCMELRLCIIVASFYLQVSNIFPHISSRDLPCHRTMILHQVYWNKVAFLFLLQRSWIQTYFCNFPRYLCQFCLLELVCWTVLSARHGMCTSPFGRWCGPPTAFPLIGPQCTVGVLAGTHWGALRCPGRMASGAERQSFVVVLCWW